MLKIHFSKPGSGGHMVLVLALGRQKQVDLCELEVSLVCIESFLVICFVVLKIIQLESY